jgi:quercetin dioxygenase-like cupin family protein
MSSKLDAFNKTRWTLYLMPVVLLLISVGTTASSDEPRQPIIHPLANANFASDGNPACLGNAVEAGNPSTGPSTVLLKAQKGCVVPWHSHSASEQLVVIKGAFQIEMVSVPSAILEPGDFVLIPSKEEHQFTCTPKSECLVLLMIDRAFDNKWAKPLD